MDDVKNEEVKVEEAKMSKGKKFGYFCLTWAPFLAYFAILLAVCFVGGIILGAKAIMDVGMDDMMLLQETLMQMIYDNVMLLGLIYGILGLICMALWYYFGCKRKQLRPQKGVLHPVNLVLIAMLAFSMQYIISYFMVLIEMLFPALMASYEELIESSGLGEVGLVAILYAAIIGPIAEEFTCRGVSMYFAKKFTKRFWLANTLQAIGFGVLHMNLVQGMYAFVLGLLLGWIYNRFQSIYVVCWFHIVFNSLSFGIMGFVDGILPQNIVFQIIWAIIMVVVAVGCVWMLQKQGKSLAEGEAA